MPRRLDSVTIVNVGYRSTNFWVVSAGRSRLLVDLGWPGMVGALLANLERTGIPLPEVTHGLATHYHIDHAGAAQDLKDRGMSLVVTPEQRGAAAAMSQWIKPGQPYTPIRDVGNVEIACDASRDFLRTLGIDGAIVHTPGHSSDSISLVLDSGIAFTGDLTPESMVAAEDPAVVGRSWQTLRERGVHTIYAGHANPYPMPAPYVA